MTRAEICARYRAGERVDDLAEAADLSRQMIYKHLHKAGEPLRGRPRAPFSDWVVRAAAGEAISDLAKEAGLPYMTLYQRMARSGSIRGLREVAALSGRQLDEYRHAVDVLRLGHADAIAIAREYQNDWYLVN